MNKQQLKESKKNLILLVIICIEFAIGLFYATSYGYDKEYQKGFQDGQANCTEKEIWVIEKPIDLTTNTIIGATAYKLNNSTILCDMFNEGCVRK